MKPIEVIVKRHGTETHRAKFETVIEANAWIAFHDHDNGAFGKLGEFTTQINDRTAELTAQAAKDNRKIRGQKVRELSQAILDIVAGHNLETLKTSEDIATMKSTFGTIQELLQANQPFTAKPLIQALTPDALVTADLIAEVLEEYDKAGTI